MHCTMRNVLFGSLHICETTRRGETECSFKCSFHPRERYPSVNYVRSRGEGTDQPHGESTWFFTTTCAASGDYKRMPLVSFNFSPHDWTLSITRVRLFCTVFAAQTEAMYKPKSSSHCCLLSVRCLNLRKSRIKSQSPRLFPNLNLFWCSFHLCPTILTTSSRATCLHLVSRE